MIVRSAARIAVVLGTGVVAASATLVGATPVLAAPAAKPVLFVSYDVKGTTTLANPDSNAVVHFAPTKLNAALVATGAFTASLPLAPVKSTFKAYGFLPATGTVVFTQVKPITGALAATPDAPLITANAVYVVTLRDVVIGNTAANVGTNCQTISPVRVTVTTQPGFDLTVGGTMSGTYDLGQFQNCGAAQKIINDTLPGSGNTLSLKFSNGVLTSPGTSTPAAVLASMLPGRVEGAPAR